MIVKRISPTEFEIEVKEQKKHVVFKLNKELKQKLEELAQLKGKTLTEIIREALSLQVFRVYNNLGGEEVTSIRLPISEVQKIDKLAERFSTTRSQIIKSKIYELLKKEGVLNG